MPTAGDLLPALPVASVALCLLAVPVLVLLDRRPNLREGVSLFVAATNFALVAWIHAAHRAGAEVAVEVFALTPDLVLALRADALGLLFALTASGLWILNTLYSIGYMRAHGEERQTRFYACFAVAIAAAMGVAFAENLFTLFVFYEVLTLSTYPLVIHRQTPEARAGARRYLGWLMGTSLAFFLPAIFLLHAVAGSLDFHAQGLLSATGVLARGDVAAGTLVLLFVLFLLGVAKSALMPLHVWLPSAMVAPTPVSALLHAVAVVKAGVFTVSRVVLHVFGVDVLRELGAHRILVGAACATILLASLVALAQDNLKRRLAYSTVSQLSYVLLGVGLLAPAAVIGGLVHIGIHAASKITLFFAAGAIDVATHRTRVSELDGIGRRMPITMGAFAVAAISMVGLPPAAGMVSKWWLVQGAAAEWQGGVLAVLVASTLLNAAYLLPIVWRAFLRPSPQPVRGVEEAPWPCVVALATTALLTLLLFFMPDGLLDLARSAVQAARSAP